MKTKKLHNKPDKINSLRYQQQLAALLLLFFATIALLIALALGFWLLVAMSDDGKTSPVFFSLDDKNAAYSIKKTDGPTPQTPTYWVIHNGDAVYVGNSKIPLDFYVGKKLRIYGSYSGRIGHKQCIVNTCHPLDGAMIDIDSIHLLQY